MVSKSCDWCIARGVSAFRCELSSAATWKADCGDSKLTVSSSFPGGRLVQPLKSRMPYLLVSTQIRLETGPTTVGDEYSDLSMMSYLGARKTTMLGNNFSEYHVDEPPRVVLDNLEKIGFRVVSMTGVGQTLVWCMHKETE